MTFISCSTLKSIVRSDSGGGQSSKVVHQVGLKNPFADRETVSHSNRNVQNHMTVLPAPSPKQPQSGISNFVCDVKVSLPLRFFGEKLLHKVPATDKATGHAINCGSDGAF